VSSNDVTSVKYSHWSIKIAPKNVYQCGVFLFWPTFQIFPAECQCSAARCVIVYLCCSCDRFAGCVEQEIDVLSFHLDTLQITVDLNTSIECYCRMWLSQQSSIKKKMYGSAFGEELYVKCLSFSLILNLKYLQILKRFLFVGI
jgi:hypothetical protein